MSPNNESPIDPMHESESREASERLSRIERQLKKARPRPVVLDLAALEHATQAAPLKSTADSPQRRRRYRWATLAGSWACGALVGAIVMFLVMRQAMPGTDSKTKLGSGERDDNRPIANHEQVETPEVERDEPDIGNERWNEWDAAVLALAAPGSERSFGRGGPGLRVGMCFPRLVQPAVEIPVSVAFDHEDNANSRGSNELSPYPTPEQSITREKLMQELLGDSSGFVL